MANFNLSSFSSEVLSGAGLARTNRFEIIIPTPKSLRKEYDARLASLYVEQTSIPPLNILVKPYKIFGPAYQRPITSEYGGDAIAVTFHVDRELKIKRFFEDWMHVIVNPDNFTVGYEEDFATQITITQIDEKENVVYGVELIGAFPRNLNLMELNNASTNQTHRLTVTFAYNLWRRTDRVKEQVDIPRPITNPQVPSDDVRVYQSNPAYIPGKQWNWSTGTLGYDQGSDLPPMP